MTTQTMTTTSTDSYHFVCEEWTSIPGGGYSLRYDINFKTVEIAPKKSGTRYDELLQEAEAKSLPGHRGQHNKLRSWGWYESSDYDQQLSVSWWAE